MNLTRKKTVLWIGASVVLCAAVACSVTVVPDGDGVTVTVVNKAFAFELKVFDPFNLTADNPAVPQAARINLFDGTPEEVPESAAITLQAKDVEAISLAPGKLQVVSQLMNGSVTVDVSIGEYDGNPCADGVYVGSFDLTVADGSVTITDTSLSLSAEAFAYILTGSFSLCLQVGANIDVQVTIDGMGIEFGQPVDDGGTTDEPACVLDSDCTGSETCVNGACVPEVTTECTVDSDCATDEVCEGGSCTAAATPECVLDSDCASGETCTDGQCVSEAAPECTTDGDCASGEVCTSGECVMETTSECATEGDCADGEVCASGECVDEDVAEFALTTAIDGTGSVDPSAGAYEPGTSVALTATAGAGWRFDRWEGDATGSDNPVTVTLNADTTITAVFVELVTSTITFRATYDRLWDTADQNPGYGILKSAMSGDGTRLVWAIQDNDTGDLSILTMNVDGSDQTIIPAPAAVDSIWEVVINYDGSRAFFRRWFNLLFKVEGGTITQILDTADVDGLGSIGSIQLTTAGDYVYFHDDEPNNNDIWRCPHTGTTAELVVDDTAVTLSNGFPVAMVADFSVSGDGGVVAFTTHGYWDSGYHGHSELFTLSGGSYTQLTTDGGDYTKSSPRVSGDGSILVFSRGFSWHSIHPDGTNEVDLGPAGYNLGGPKVIFDGSKMLYSDNESEGTVLLNTDGSGRQNIVPSWNITNIAIAATYHHAISDDATRVSFYTQFGILPENAAFYVGYLEDPNVVVPTVTDGPFIDSIAFSPGSFPRSRSDAALLLHASISDTDGLADVTNAAVDEMLDGIHAGSVEVPVYFYFSPRDDGESSDDVSADGVFVSSASAGDMLDTLDSVTIRVSAMDSDKTITIADTVLIISP